MDTFGVITHKGGVIQTAARAAGCYAWRVPTAGLTAWRGQHASRGAAISAALRALLESACRPPADSVPLPMVPPQAGAELN